MTDPISDMLTRIRNAAMARRQSVSFPHSKIKEAIIAILKAHNFVEAFKVEEQGPFKVITVQLNGEGADTITTLKRVSKPGRRVYAASQDIPRVLSGRGIVIVSTSTGLMTGTEARKQGLGGELICKIW